MSTATVAAKGTEEQGESKREEKGKTKGDEESNEQQIEALEKRIADGKTTQDMLQQAEKDVKHIREETESVLEGMQNE